MIAQVKERTDALSVALVDDDWSRCGKGLIFNECWKANALACRGIRSMPQGGGHAHQAVHGEATEVGVAHAGEVRRSEPGFRSRVSNGQSASVEYSDDIGGQNRLGVLEDSVGITEIPEDVARSIDQFEIGFFGHLDSSSLTRRSRSLTRSISGFGVRIPVFDFFWNA